MYYVPSKIINQINNSFNECYITNIEPVENKEKQNVSFNVQLRGNNHIYELEFNATGELIKKTSSPEYAGDEYEGCYYGEGAI